MQSFVLLEAARRDPPRVPSRILTQGPAVPPSDHIDLLSCYNVQLAAAAFSRARPYVVMGLEVRDFNPARLAARINAPDPLFALRVLIAAQDDLASSDNERVGILSDV